MNESLTNTTKHYPWLDWARFLAAAIVFMGHARVYFLGAFVELPPNQQTPFVAFFLALIRISHEAVIVFFVLSGFFVFGKGISRLIKEEFSILDYSIDRFTRIYVPYIPALILTWIFAALMKHPVSVWVFILNIFGLQGITTDVFAGNVPLWTLSYEIWFYILLGAVAGFTKFQKDGYGSVRFVISIIFLFLSAIVFTVLSTTLLFCWLIGGLAYFYRPKKIQLPIIFVSILVCIFAVISIELRVNSVSVDFTRWLAFFPSSRVAEILLAAGFAALIPQLISLPPRNIMAQRIENIGTQLASFSYSLYLTHYALLQFLYYYFFPKYSEISFISLAYLFASCCLSFITAYIMYLLFEKHTNKARRFLRSKFFKNK